MVKRQCLILMSILLLVIKATAMATAGRRLVLPAAQGLTQYSLKSCANSFWSDNFNKRFVSDGDAIDRDLHRAVRGDNAQLIRDFLARGAANASKKNIAGDMPLQFIVGGNRVQSVRPSLHAGFDINSVRSALLQLAVRYNSVDAVRTLLELGVDSQILDRNGNPLLHNAETPKMALLLIDHGAQVEKLGFLDNTVLHNAQNVRMINFWLDQGLDINAKNKYGVTPLHEAIYKVDNLRALLTRGANVDAINNLGETPLHQVLYVQGRVDIVKALIDAGADVEIMDKQGALPINIAAVGGNIEIINLLVDAKLEKSSR